MVARSHRETGASVSLNLRLETPFFGSSVHHARVRRQYAEGQFTEHWNLTTLPTIKNRGGGGGRTISARSIRASACVGNRPIGRLCLGFRVSQHRKLGSQGSLRQTTQNAYSWLGLALGGKSGGKHRAHERWIQEKHIPGRQRVPPKTRPARSYVVRS